MSEHTKEDAQEVKDEPQSFSKQASNKPGPKPKQPKIKNTTGRPISLIISRNNKVTILPTQTEEVSKEFLADIKKNSGVMVYFDNGDLVEV